MNPHTLRRVDLLLARKEGKISKQKKEPTNSLSNSLLKRENKDMKTMVKANGNMIHHKENGHTSTKKRDKVFDIEIFNRTF